MQIPLGVVHKSKSADAMVKKNGIEPGEGRCQTGSVTSCEERLADYVFHFR
jgi:hypothetical protein